MPAVCSAVGIQVPWWHQHDGKFGGIVGDVRESVEVLVVIRVKVEKASRFGWWLMVDYGDGWFREKRYWTLASASSAKGWWVDKIVVPQWRAVKRRAEREVSDES